MKGVIVHSTRTKVFNPAIYHILFNYFLFPLKSGLYGFAAFFTIVIVIKAVMNLLGSSDYFIVNTEDVLLSSIGLGLVFIIRLIQNIKNLHGTTDRNS